MEKIKFKGKLNISLLVKCAIALVFPAIVCLVYCAVRHVGIGELFLPASYNNDCVFYYKQIEAILSGGVPDGYFGFNESRAAVGGLAAWSPLIYFPWIVWGRIFGWNFASVLVCNVVLFGVALCLFTYLTKPGDLSFGLSLGALLLFPSFPIHLLNALPEAVVASVFIVFLGMSVRCCDFAFLSGSGTGKNEDQKAIPYIVGAFIAGSYLTVIRPYMIVFLAIPVYVLIKRYGKKAIAVSAAGLIATLLIYVFVNKYFTADYFSPLFDTGIVKLALQGRIEEAFWSAVYVVKDMSAGIGSFVLSAFDFGSTAGTQYVLAFLGAVISAVLFFDKKEKSRRLVYLVYFIAVVLLFGAIVLFLQKANEGARHLWVFSVAGCLLIPEALRGEVTDGYAGKKGRIHLPYYFLKLFSVVILIVFMLRGSIVPTDYDIPIGTKELREEISLWEEAFKSVKPVDKTTNGYENTVAWVFVDYDGEDMIVTEYAPLYVLPKKMGISCCYPDHILDDLDSVKSRFIYTDSRGKVAALCSEKGMSVVAKIGNTIIFERSHE